MKKAFLHNFFCTACFIVLFSFLALNSLSGFADSQTSVFTSVLRLHVIASGNSEKEQELKLKVRDAILDTTQNLFYSCKNVDEALKIAKNNSALLCDTAKRTAQNNGYDGSVTLEISKEYYPEKTYEDLTFPKGKYLSVRIILGNGLGKNWWCVLFPPLCNAGVEDKKNVLLNYGFKESQIEKLQAKNNPKSIKIKDTLVSLKLFELFS